MGVLLAFALFIVLAVLDRLVGALSGLIAVAIVAAILLLRDCVAPHRQIKLRISVR